MVDRNGLALTVGGGFDAIMARDIRTLTIQNGKIVDPSFPGGDGALVGAVVSPQVTGITRFGRRATPTTASPIGGDNNTLPAIT